ncbi:MAG: DNA/RNA non-specific endonuclease [Bacteroidales bacterium]|nr:DNA/RNA non-specific endonuclease [Bacteroidales bacterium]
MKKIFPISLCAWLVLAVTLGGCRSGIHPDRPVEHQVTFMAINEALTRTTLTEGEDRAVFYWDAEDEDRLLVWENGVAAKKVMLTADDTGRTAMITATFDGSPAGSAEYTALLSTLQDESTSAPVIRADQYPRDESFDPDADILIADPLTATPGGDLRSMVFRFRRPVAISKVTFKGLASGETISAVGITGDQNLTGTYNVRNASFTDGAKSISIDCAYLIQGSGAPSVFFVTAPVSEATLSFRVITNRGSYRKTLQRPLSFTTSEMTRFNVNLSGCKEEQVDDTWKLLTGTSGLAAGKEIVFAYNSKDVVAGSLSGTYLSPVKGSTFGSDKQTITSLADDAQIFTLGGSAGAWTFSKPGGQKLGTTAAKKLAWDDGTMTWALSFSSGKLKIASTTSSCGELQYNASSPRFTTYVSSSNQNPIQIYYRDGSGKPKLTMSPVTCIQKGTTYLFFGWDPVPNAHHYGVTFDDGDEKLISSTTYVAQYLAEGSLHTIQVRAICDTDEYDNSVYVSCTAKTDTTQPQTDTDQKGWFELPVMYDADHNGICDTDNTLYYAYHEFSYNNRKMRNFTVCFSSEHHCPVWVAAPRHQVYQDKNVNRSDAYKADPNIPSSIQYYSKDTGGGCNKGHMLGSAERLCCSEANRQVFYYSNIAPQDQTSFNTGGGAWNNLEDFVDLLVVSDTLYEVIGCYFERFVDKYGTVSEPQTISFGGRNDVSKPTMFYYALLRTKSGTSGKAVTQCSANELQCAAFVISHAMAKGHKPQVKDMMSIKDLEDITGFTYFPNVPHAPKDTFSASDWGL